MHYLLLILAVLFWSGNFVVSRGIINEIPPMTLAFWRWTIALLIILPFALKPIMRQKHLIRQNWKILTVLAILSVSNFSMWQPGGRLRRAAIGRLHRKNNTLPRVLPNFESGGVEKALFWRRHEDGCSRSMAEWRQGHTGCERRQPYHLSATERQPLPARPWPQTWRMHSARIAHLPKADWDRFLLG